MKTKETTCSVTMIPRERG